MEWLLVVILLLPGQAALQTQVGLINGADICNLTGRAIVAQVTRESPDVQISFVCLQQVSA